jgi:glyoxylase-like metal-dependent hydrolase (beta-lactamase superfamily II)
MHVWYEQVPVGDDLVRVGEPRVGELLSANVWWLHGADRDVVVDTGLGVVDLRTQPPLMFERDPLALLTHAHLDHVGGAHAFSERAAHPAEAAVLANGVPASLYGALFSGDVVYDGPLIDDLPESDVADYRCSLARLHSLVDRYLTTE